MFQEKLFVIETQVAIELETHPGTEHGFCFKERPAFHEQAAERVWVKLFDPYARTLKHS